MRGVRVIFFYGIGRPGLIVDVVNPKDKKGDRDDSGTEDTSQ